MILAKVEGSVVSTVGHPTLKGWRLLICQPLDGEDNEVGNPVIAIDNHGAGVGDKIIYTTDGRATSEAVGTRKTPLRNMIIAIVDQ